MWRSRIGQETAGRFPRETRKLFFLILVFFQQKMKCGKHPKPSGKFSRGGNVYCVNCLWEMDLPLRVVPIRYLAPFLDIWLWAEGTPRQVMEGRAKDVERHFERVRDADLSFPIHVVAADGYPPIDLLDGLHRLYRAIQLGDTSIRAYICPPGVFPPLEE